MDQYVTGAAIKSLREKLGLKQAELGEKLGVSDKTISKWETGRGFPDITLIEPLAKVLGVSTLELLSGRKITNRNTACNLARSPLYVCPVCGNILHGAGEAVVSCCGITLPPLEAEEADLDHGIRLEKVENENYISIDHPMTKSHFISFIAIASGDRFDLVKLYPEGSAEAHFPSRGHATLYWYCNRHGLFQKRL